MAGAGLVWAVLAAKAGRLSPGDVTVFVAAIAAVQSTLSALTTRVGGIHHTLVMLDHFEKATTVPPDLPTPGAVAAPRELRDGIRLENVWPADLRQRIGTVFQDYVEYELSAADNIGLGDVARRTDRPIIERAAALAGLDRVLGSLPKGYDTMLTRIFVDEEDLANPESGVLPTVTRCHWSMVWIWPLRRPADWCSSATTPWPVVIPGSSARCRWMRWWVSWCAV